MNNTRTQVYVVGNAQNTGGLAASNEFVSIKFADENEALNIKKVRCSSNQGRNFVFVATMNDDSVQLFGVGLNLNGELFPHKQAVDKFTKLDVASKSKVTKAVVGSSSLLLLTEDNRLLSQGTITVQLLPNNPKIIDIQSSFYYQYCLTEDGILYEITSHGTHRIRETNVQQFAAGGEHLLIQQNGSWGLWFCGDSSGSTNGYAISGEKIIYAQCGWESSYFLTDASTIYNSGASSYSGLVVIDKSQDIGHIDKICVPVDSLLVLSKGRLFVHGSTFGNNVLGTGKEQFIPGFEEVVIDNPVKSSRIVDIHHTYEATYVVFESTYNPMKLHQLQKHGSFCDVEIN